MKTRQIASSAALLTGLMLMTGCSANSGTAGTVGQNLTPSAAPANVDNTEIASAAATEQPSGNGKISLRRNFYFVFDGSGSMKEPPRTRMEGNRSEDSKIEGAKWAVHQFMNKVPDDVNIGLYVFDRMGKREVLPLGPNNREKFLRDVDNISAGGGTPLGAAISRGANALTNQYNKQLGYGEYRLIVITDGEATDRLADGVSAAVAKHIPIYTIGFDIGQDHALRKHSLAYRSAASAKEVEEGLEEAAAELDVFDQASFNGNSGGKRKPARQG